MFPFYFSKYHIMAVTTHFMKHWEDRLSTILSVCSSSEKRKCIHIYIYTEHIYIYIYRELQIYIYIYIENYRYTYISYISTKMGTILHAIV